MLTQSGARTLLSSDQLEGQQSATSTLSGNTGGSTGTSVTLSIGGNDSISVNGHASTAANGEGGATQGSSKTSGYVRKGTDKEDAPYVANTSVGITAAEGGAVNTSTEDWGSSGQGPDGPTANAGHNVVADGAYTGSTGDQAVALLSEKP